jgi:hypothetical protein
VNLATAFTGGDKLAARLKEIADGLDKGGQLRCGFLEGSTKADGQPLPPIAAVHEFGGTIEHPGGTRYINDAVVGKGDKAHIGTRFVGKDFVGETETTKAHAITIPARPFFRPMIAKHQDEWGDALAAELRANDYDAQAALKAVGKMMESQLVQSINDVTSPPLSAATVRRKGFEKPLIDTGVMWQSVDSEVSEP